MRMQGGARRSDAGFELGYRAEDGVETREPLSSAYGTLFELVPPVRAFPSYRGQRNFPGYYYAATLDAHVACESWLERDTAMALDFDPAVVGFAAQPFWLLWSGRDRLRSHAPDFFARRADGTGVVLDCRPAQRIRARDEEAFAATEQACSQAGWTYRLVTGHDPVWRENLRWLAGYRHARCYDERWLTPLLEAFAAPQGLHAGVRTVGDLIAVLPMAFHLLWRGQLRADLTARLDATTLVEVAT